MKQKCNHKKRLCVPTESQPQVPIKCENLCWRNVASPVKACGYLRRGIGPKKTKKNCKRTDIIAKSLRDPFQITHTAESSRCKWYSTPEQTTEVMQQGWTLAAAQKQLLFTVSYGTSWSEIFTETR
uniref:Uncharacterized protein n=1 Tax=Triticum urartu TaxID=4572 RepID=A0A8R7PNK5_TRIUA